MAVLCDLVVEPVTMSQASTHQHDEGEIERRDSNGDGIIVRPE